MAAATNSAITSQPIAKGAVEIKPMERDDADFAGPMVVEAFRSKFENAVGKDKLGECERFMTREMSTRPEGGFANHFIAWVQGKRAGYLCLKYHDSKQLLGDVSFGEIGCCCGGIRLTIFDHYVTSHKLAKDMCYLETIAVSAEVRGMGIGAQLMAKADQEALQHGCSRISLHVAEGNPAIHLYERSGYKPIGEMSNCCLERSVGIRRFHEVCKNLETE